MTYHTCIMSLIRAPVCILEADMESHVAFSSDLKVGAEFGILSFVFSFVSANQEGCWSLTGLQGGTEE